MKYCNYSALFLITKYHYKRAMQIPLRLTTTRISAPEGGLGRMNKYFL
jgi:hypothetical protein